LGRYLNFYIQIRKRYRLPILISEWFMGCSSKKQKQSFMETGDIEEINLFTIDELLTVKCYKIYGLLPLKQSLR
jgi:hypothetical protein